MKSSVTDMVNSGIRELDKLLSKGKVIHMGDIMNFYSPPNTGKSMLGLQTWLEAKKRQDLQPCNLRGRTSEYCYTDDEAYFEPSDQFGLLYGRGPQREPLRGPHLSREEILQATYLDMVERFQELTQELLESRYRSRQIGTAGSLLASNPLQN